jgi:hypothetical protein
MNRAIPLLPLWACYRLTFTFIHNGNVQHNMTNVFTTATPVTGSHTINRYYENKNIEQGNKNHTVKIFTKWKTKITTALLKCSLIPAFRERKKSMAQRYHTKYVDTKQFLGFCKQGNEPSGSSLSPTIISHSASRSFRTHGSVCDTVMP